MTDKIFELNDAVLETQKSENDSYVSFYVAMYDEGLKELLERTALLDKTNNFNDFEEIIEGDAYLNVYLSAYGNGTVTMNMALDEMDNIYEISVPLTEEEQQKLFELADRAMEKEGGVKSVIKNALAEYEQNHLEPSRDKQKLIDEIEQFMYERGEYDFSESDRIRWLNDIPEPYLLAINNDALQEARSDVSKNIEESMATGARIEPLVNYLKGQTYELDTDDELYAKAQGLMYALEDYKSNALNEYLRATTAKELENASGTLSIEAVELLKENFNFFTMYEYLENTYGDAGFDLSDGLSTNDIVTVDSHSDDDKWNVSETEMEDIADDIASDVIDYLASIEPALAVDKEGNEAILPLFQTEDGTLITAHYVEKTIEELIPTEAEITEYGKKIDTDFYTQPEYEERKGYVNILSDFDAVDYLKETARENVDAVKQEYRRDIDTKLAYETIEAVNCSVKENDAGTFDVIDGLTGEYRAIDCTNLSEVIESLGGLVDNAFLDYLADELYRSDDFEAHKKFVGEIEIPQKAEDWKAITENPDFAKFTQDYQGEIEIIDLLANPDRLKEARIADVAYTFNPEDDRYNAYNLKKIVDANEQTVSMHGNTYKATEEAKKVLSELSYSDFYKIKLNGDMTFELHTFEDLSAAKTQQMSETLADFVNAKGMKIDVVEKYGMNWYVLYDKELGDYRKNEHDLPELMRTADSLMENMGTYVNEVQYDLEDAFELTFGNSEKEVPSTASEWVSFAGRRDNGKFAQEYEFEIDVMRLSVNDTNGADIIKKAYEIQNDRQTQDKAKEQPTKAHKKFDRTDD